MRVPELVYRFLYPKDVAGPTFELCPRTTTTAATSNVILVAFPGPSMDRVLCLTNIFIRADPGATQAAIQLLAFLTTPGGLDVNIAGINPDVSADTIQTLNWSGEIYIGGGGSDSTILTMSGVFDAGVASNSVSASFFGVVIPRGTIAPF